MGDRQYQECKTKLQLSKVNNIWDFHHSVHMAMQSYNVENAPGFFFRGNSKKCVVIDQRKTTNYLFFQPVLNFHSVIYVDVLFVQIQFFTGIYILEKALDGYKDESEI